MGKMRKAIAVVCILLSFAFLSVGYAQLTENLHINGSASVQGFQYDIYITNVTPDSLGTISVNDYYYTIMSTSVHGASQPTFTVTVKNQSDKIYVFERIVEGRETGFDGIYGGEGITYTLNGLTFLQEVAPGGELTFRVTIKATSSVNTDQLLTFFKFIEKTGEEILPGNPDAETTVPEETTRPTEPDVSEDPPDTGNPEETTRPVETTAPTDPTPPEIDPENNYYGLLEILLSENKNCLNDPSDKDVIYEAVQKELKKAPHILHCLTNSVSGGNMTSITTAANSQLSVKMHFLFLPVQGDENTMYLYMYHEDDVENNEEGTPILTYFAVIRYFENTGHWDEDGVYTGKANIAYLSGGGNAAKKVWLIDPSTWTAGAPKTTN